MPNSKDFNHFAYNPTNIDISRSLFNMDHSVKFSCNVGEVIPFDCIEVLPGDTFSIDTSKVVRLQPLVTPIMDEVILDVYYFFVPHRLVWNHWINFMGENTESAWAPETTYTVPKIYIPSGGFEVGTIADYLGVPPLQGKNSGYGISALPFRSYALICDQWFRSEAIQDPVHVFVDDTNRTGVNTGDQVSDIELGGKPFIACKFFDYFTSALPSPQRGQAANVFPQDVVAPVLAYSDALQQQYGIVHPYSKGSTYPGTPVDVNIRDATEWKIAGQRNLGTRNYDDNSHSVLAYSSYGQTVTPATSTVAFGNLFASLPASTFNVNDLRTAFAIQRYLERSARYGGRYQEFIKGFFNVDSPDARLQRSEYLGGSRLSLNINSVEQTSATESGSTPQGNVAGMSATADMNSDFTKSFTEHGYIIGCSVLRYHHSYQQGLSRMWNRKEALQFYNPVFANLGEQEIKQSEIYLDDSTIYDEEPVFGYQERWSEYRYLPNRVAGEMRSSAPTPLDMWHLADFYTSAPTLSPEWIMEDKTMLDRCLAVTSEVANQCICDFYIKVEASRPMPLYSIPGLIDHH